MKKTIVAAICLSLCLLSASCGSDGADTPSAATDNTTSETTPSSAAQSEYATELTVPSTTKQTAPSTTNQTVPSTTKQAASETIPPQGVDEKPALAQTSTQSAPEALSFSDLPTEFVFSSGAGGWDTTLTIHRDGTFDGLYHDSEALQLYYSTFNGRFGQPQKTGKYTYRVTIDDFQVTNDINKVFHKEDIEYIPADPYGLEHGTSELTLYVPGTPLSEMPEECRSWLLFYENSNLADGDYVLYNAQEGNAFFGSRG